MDNGYPCPNPACGHVFPTEFVNGAAELMCPRCGALFQFRVPAAAPAYPAAVAPAAAAVPLAQPLEPSAPLPVAPVVGITPAPAAPVPPEALPYESAPPPEPRLARASRTELYLLIFLLLASAAGGGIYYAYSQGFRFQFTMGSGNGDGGNSQREGPGASPDVPKTLYGEGAVYSLPNKDGLWRLEKLKTKRQYEADLAAWAVSPDDANSRADLRVLKFRPADPDLGPAQVVDRRYRKDFPDATFEEIENRQAAFGKMSGRLVKLRVRENPVSERFAALAIVSREEHTIVVVLDCALDQRERWEVVFDRMLAQFRVGNEVLIEKKAGQ